MVKKKKKKLIIIARKKNARNEAPETQRNAYTHIHTYNTHTRIHTYSCLVLYSFFILLERSTLNSFSKRFFPFEGGIFLQKWIQRSIEFNAREIDRFQRLFPLPPPPSHYDDEFISRKIPCTACNDRVRTATQSNKTLSNKLNRLINAFYY